MIKVSHLTKRFAGCTAVNDVSFEVGRGEIVGFLGPNGAGKSTTMRMLACYLPATSGSILVTGRNVLSDSLEVRRRIGYMPENVPLYPEMRVDEYLRFRARIKGVEGSLIRKRVHEVKELCGLKDVGRRLIGQLSKGYRQRVGLADSLVHDPELLILDEPTIGLDPNQIRQVRALIKDLAQRHTILLSTHILSEVEMTCQRVLILNEGRIVASDSPENLKSLLQSGSQIVAEMRGPREEMYEKIRTLPRVQRVAAYELDSWVCFTIDCEKDADLRIQIFELAVRHNWELRELRIGKKSLEEIFVALTRGEPEEVLP
ncbi:MAG TPA: ABC transporter [Verrucomicrobia bacterium]|nr:MAG: ABC transporter [Lentisphaerae bacterium GWF2_57_35]HBA84617.1 ABC transporter [Verrucomicrobiota bacterium]